MKVTILRSAFLIVLFSGLAGAADAPVLPELDRLRLIVMVRDFEVAQLKAEAASKEAASARDRVVARLKELDASAPGFHFDLGTMSFVAEEK